MLYVEDKAVTEIEALVAKAMGGAKIVGSGLRPQLDLPKGRIMAAVRAMLASLTPHGDAVITDTEEHYVGHYRISAAGVQRGGPFGTPADPVDEPKGPGGTGFPYS